MVVDCSSLRDPSIRLFLTIVSYIIVRVITPLSIEVAGFNMSNSTGALKTNVAPWVPGWKVLWKVRQVSPMPLLILTIPVFANLHASAALVPFQRLTL